MATGHQKLLEQFLADGFECMFGNPGSSEEGLIDALRHFPPMGYVLGLQESAVLAMADGYCRAKQRPALVQLHTGVGLGNAIGLLYQARRGHSPLVVIAGEAGVAYSAMDGQMAVDLVAMGGPVTKWAGRVEHPAHLLRLVRRAVKESMTPPTGPVFLAIPQDILDAENHEPVVRTVLPEAGVAPSADALEDVAGILAGAEHPLILIGDGISRAGAQKELAAVATAIGAKVLGVNNSEVNLPQSHPLYGGVTGHMFGADSAARVAGADAVLVVGTYLFPEVFPSLTSPFDANCQIIHIEPDPYEIAKNHPVTRAFVADPKATLAGLATALERVVSGSQKEAVACRVKYLGDKAAADRVAAKAKDEQDAASQPLRFAVFAAALSRRLPEDAILFDEALTHSAELTRWIPADTPGQFFQTRGGSLGVGFPGAIGVKLAHPKRTVVGISGDGGCMYTIQALWTAAHHKVGAKFVVVVNGGYRLLKLNLMQYWKALDKPRDQFPGCFDLTAPNLDFVGLARAMGVAGVKVVTNEQIEDAVEKMLADNAPFLVEVVVDGSV